MNVLRTFSFLLASPLLAFPLAAQAGQVLSEHKISATSGGFPGVLNTRDDFGVGVAPLGDLDGDGVVDLAVGCDRDDDGGLDRGAVWILFLNADATVRATQKISMTAGGFGGTLDRGDLFGTAVDCLGDLDGDGTVDLAVGAWQDDDGGANRGAVWILFLNADGTVKGEQKISQTAGGFGGALLNGDAFGYSLDTLDDLDGDGVVDLAVGSMWDDDGGTDRGAVWILFLNADGTVKAAQKISQTAGGFGGALANTDTLGVSMASLGDLDGDGICDVASGADHDDEGGNERGAMWILFLNADGTVKAEQKISSVQGGFDGALSDNDYFGLAAAGVGDLDGDGRGELVVNAGGDPAGTSRRGALWILFLHPDGTVRARHKIGDQVGGFDGALDEDDWFGYGVADLGDLDGDGFPDLAAGTIGDDDGATDCGAVWILRLQGCPAAQATPRNPDVGGTINPDVYTVTAPPVLGADFVASIVTASHTGCVLHGYATPFTLGTRWGNLLVGVFDPAGELLGTPVALGDPAVIAQSVPDDPALCGVAFATQAVRFGGGFDLTNAQDLVVGR